MGTIESTLIPIFVCVVLPVSIVLIISISKVIIYRLRTKIILKAIESNDFDTEKIAMLLRKRERTALQVLNLRLLRGCIFTLLGISFLILAVAKVWMDLSLVMSLAFLSIGISYLIVYFVTRIQTKSEDNSVEC